MPEITDRRVRRTRRLLQDGLLSLMQYKAVADISVKELAEAADVARATVYVHFKDPEDVLRQLEQGIYADLEGILSGKARGAALLQAVFSLVLDNRTAFEALLGEHGDRAFVEDLRALCVERAAAGLRTGGMQENALAYKAAFLVGGYENLLRRWLLAGCKETPAELARLAGQML